MTPLLRRAGAEDAERVADILIGTRSAFMPYAPSAHPDEDVRTWVASKLLPSGGVWVAEINRRVVGAMATTTGPVDSLITQMAVEPSLVGQSIGTQLLVHAVQVLTPPIRLWTFQENLGARRFYERHGFVAIQFTDGRGNEEGCPDVQYELRARRADASQEIPSK